MAAYLLIRVAVHDPVQYEEYKLRTPAVVGAFGGEFIVRGGLADVVEGEPDDRRVVVVRFPTIEQARAFLNSPEYAAVKAYRIGAADMEIVVVEGS